MSASSREEMFLNGLPELPPDIVTFAKHYLALAGARGVPTVRTFLDNPPFSLMARVVIADMPEDEDYKVRYFGTAVAEALGRDVTGMTARVAPKGDTDPVGIRRGRIAFAHPCGFLSRRLIYRNDKPGALDTVSEFLAISLPITPDGTMPGILHYYSFPRPAAGRQGKERNPLAIKIMPVCWLDIGAGIPAMPV
jgi:hypothetical protein